MEEPVFVLSSDNKMLAVFSGYGSLVEVLTLLKSYITGKIHSDGDNIYADIEILSDEILERCEIKKHDSYRLRRVSPPSMEQILVYEVLNDYNGFYKLNGTQTIKKPS